MTNTINEIITLILMNKNIIIICLGYLILLLTSGKLVIFILSRVEHEKNGAQTRLPIKNANNKQIKFASKNELDTGFIIGKCENILILSLVLLGAYTALALIFAAKTIIREDEIKNNSLYFLAGTMINVTYSIVVGLIIKSILNI
jgi:hypothetical protein